MVNFSAISNSLPGTHLADPVGIGLRHTHYQDILNSKPSVGWLEIHPENFFGGGMNRHFLEKARQDYDISFHAVGLSLGSADGISEEHLQKIKDLIDIFEPFQFSDHASWSASGNAHLNDLLPLPYTQESLQKLCDNINMTQDFLGRQILVENPSTYINFARNEMEEYEFMNEAARRTGCLLLLDLNNIYVQAINHNKDPHEYISSADPDKIGEMHLAGFTEHTVDDTHIILIDTHSKPVLDPVWDLYAYAVERFGKIPTLIEWDEDLPPLDTLVQEANKARNVMEYAIHNQEKMIHAAE